MLGNLAQVYGREKQKVSPFTLKLIRILKNRQLN